MPLDSCSAELSSSEESSEDGSAPGASPVLPRASSILGALTPKRVRGCGPLPARRCCRSGSVSPPRSRPTRSVRPDSRPPPALSGTVWTPPPRSDARSLLADANVAGSPPCARPAAPLTGSRPDPQGQARRQARLRGPCRHHSAPA